MASIATRTHREEYNCKVRHRVNGYVAATDTRFINFIHDIYHVGLGGTEGKVLFVAPSTEEEGGGKYKDTPYNNITIEDRDFEKWKLIFWCLETVISLNWTNNMFTVNFGHELTTNLKKSAMKMQVLPVKKDSSAEVVFVLEDDTSKPLKVDTTPTAVPEKEVKSPGRKSKREPQQEGPSNNLTASFKEMRARRPTDSSRDIERATVRWESVSYHIITHHKNTSGVSLFFNKLVGDGDMLIETGIDLPPREQFDKCQVCHNAFMKEKEKGYCQLCGKVIHVKGPCHIDMPLQEKYLDDMKELNKNLSTLPSLIFLSILLITFFIVIHCCVECEALIEAGVALQQWKIERKKHEKLAALLAKISRGSRSLRQCRGNGDKVALKECLLTVEADLNQLKNTKVEGETWETLKNNIIRTLNEYLLLCKSSL